jgi:peroxiredoxin
MEYRYEHFHPTALLEDAAFWGGPEPGERMPDFELPTTDGGRVALDDFLGRRPLLLTFGSVT